MDITVDSLARLPQHLAQELANYRYRVFVERLGWELDTENEQETDQFDGDDTVYVIAREHGKVVGCARLLPTVGPYLLGDVFPQLLSGQPIPRRADVWELSRFAAVALDAAGGAQPFGGQFSSPTARGLLRAALQGAAARGARELITVSPLGVERLLRQAGFVASRMAKPHRIDGHLLFACRIAVRN